MEGEIFSKLGFIFMVKGNDVQPFSMTGLSKFDPSKELIEGGTPHKIKELLGKGYELAVDDGSEKGKHLRSIINNSNVLSNSSFNPSLSSDLNSRMLRNVKSIGSGLGKILPSIAGFSTPIGAIASGLLYAGTSKPAGAGSAPMDYFDTPFQPQGFTPTDTSPRISESFDRDPVVFDRHMQDKMQNFQNNQGIMGARTKPQAPPGQPVIGRHIGYNAGGIASLRR